MKTRIYLSTNGDGDRLIKAASQAEAQRHATAHITTRLATGDDIAHLVTGGIKIEEAKPASPDK